MDGRGLRPLITVCVITYNRKNDLLEALRSVRGQTYRPIEMLVVDNGSSDGTVETVRSEFQEARIVCLERNYGCPEGRNRGLANASGEFVFFADDDGFLDKEAVELAYKAISRDERIAVVSGKVIDHKTGETVFDRDGKFADSVFFLPEFQGGVSLHRRGIYGEMSLYPGDYVYGGEERHLSLRLLDKGYLILRDPAVILYHKVCPLSVGQIQKACLNRIIVACQLYPAELAVFYAFYGTILWFISACRRNFLLEWIKAIPLAAGRMFSACAFHRTPVSRRTLMVFEKLRMEVVVSAEEVFRTEFSYGKFLLKLLRVFTRGVISAK